MTKTVFVVARNTEHEVTIGDKELAISFADLISDKSGRSVAVREYLDITNEDGTVVRQPKGVVYQICFAGYVPLGW